MKKNIIAFLILAVITTSCFTNQLSEWTADITVASSVKVGETNTATLSFRVPNKLSAPTASPFLTREQLVSSAYKVYAYICTCGTLGDGEAYYILPEKPAGTGNPANHPFTSEIEIIEPPMLPQRLPVLVEATYNADSQTLSANFKYKVVGVPQMGYTQLSGGFFYLPAGTSPSEYQQAKWFAGVRSAPKITVVP